MWLRRHGRYWYLCSRVGGRVREKSLRTSDYLAASALRERAEQAAQSVGGPVADMPASHAVAAYLDTLRAAGRADGTLSQHRDWLRVLVSVMGDQPGEWQRATLAARLRTHGWSPRSQLILLSVARAFRRWCLAERIACADIFDGHPRPRPRPREPDPIPEECIAPLLAAATAHPYLGPPVALALLAGLSLGDLRAIDWRQADLRRRVIRLRRRKTGQPVIIPMAPVLHAVLSGIRGRTGAVCRGLPIHDAQLRRDLLRLLASAGVPPPAAGTAAWHRLRHTFATRLVASGADLPTVARLMGHRPGSTVTLRYLHGSPDRDRAAIERAWGVADPPAGE